MSVSRAVSDVASRVSVFDIELGLLIAPESEDESTNTRSSADFQPSVAPSSEQRNMLLDREESDGENEIGDDELLDEDDMVGASVSFDLLHISGSINGTDNLAQNHTISKAPCRSGFGQKDGERRAESQYLGDWQEADSC